MDIIFGSAIVPLAIGIGFLFVAAIYEWKTYRVPNVLTLASLIGAFAFAIVAPIMVPERSGGLISALAGMIVGGTMLLPLYAKANLGAGCIKAQAAFGAWAGSGLALVPCLTFVGLGTLFAIVIGVTVWYSIYRQQANDPSKLKLFHGQLPLTLGTVLGVVVATMI